MNKEAWRIYALSAVVFLLMGLLLLRLSWLGIYRHTFYEARAERQQLITQTIEASRGNIFVQEKGRTIPVATTKKGWLLAVDTRSLGNPKDVYEKLVRLGSLRVSEESFIQKASKPNDPYEVVEHRIEADAKQRILEERMSGVLFSEERWRFYPAGSLGAHLLGFVDADNIGQYGVERFYDKELRGENGIFTGQKTLGGNLLFFGEQLIRPEKNGFDIVLTIDAGAQSFVERTVHDAAIRYNAVSAGGIVINPKNGRIIAMAAYPTFDPNRYSKEKNLSVFKNPLVESLFEMGSVVKPLTMAAAFDAGVINAQTTYNDVGSREIDGRKISNHDSKAHGRLPMQEILSQSLNMGAVFLEEQLGKERFLDYFRKYGLGEKTNIDVPNEARGNLKNLDSMRSVEFATASFGQGISLSPIGLVRALSAIANGGLLVNPRVVERVGYEDRSQTTSQNRILKEEAAQEVTRMLVEIVDKKLLNGKAKILGYSVAAKTGTAQVAASDRRGYSDEFMHTFFGFGPAYNPEFLVFYYLERPHGVRYASETLTESFKSTMKFLFSYFEVPPDRPQELDTQHP